MTRHAMPAARAAAVLALALVAGAGALGREARAEDWADDHRWSVMPAPERDQPGVERAGTLRIVRIDFDGGDPLRDRGTLVGWVNAAASGDVPQRREESPEDALLEIVNVKIKPAPAAPAAPAE